MDHERMRRLHALGPVKTRAFEIALTDKTLIAANTWLFVFTKPDNFTYRTGQHIRLSLMDVDISTREPASGFFSIAGIPSDGDLRFAMRAGDSVFKRAMLSLEQGQTIRLETLRDVPHGGFHLPENNPQPVVFIAGGIGVVPAYALIREATQRGVKQKLILFFSDRCPEDAPFLAELMALSQENPYFTLVTTMTRPDTTGTWSGATGRIDREKVAQYVRTPKLALYYLTGFPDMVGAMRQMLIGIGVDKGRILAEAWSMTQHSAKSHRGARTGFGAGIIIVAAVVALHLGLLRWIFTLNRWPDLLSFQTPGQHPYLIGLIGLVAVVLALKIVFFRNLHENMK